jgi:hypothetical protein
MNDDQFTQLFKAVQNIQSQVSEMATKEDIKVLRDEVHIGFDQIASRLDDDDAERGALQSEVNRHDVQIHEIADHVGMKLSEQA